MTSKKKAKRLVQSEFVVGKEVIVVTAVGFHGEMYGPDLTRCDVVG